MPSEKQKEQLLREFQTSSGATFLFLVLFFIDARGDETISFRARYLNPRLAKPIELTIGAKGLLTLRAAIDDFECILEQRTKRGARRAAS